ncbi:MAG TPA: MTH938/NDUFAF3 family protein [Solirubrobacterales bacterium]|nr:MTH938/NDUFAF3 family protein [Solirubrobacterales bacterium]
MARIEDYRFGHVVVDGEEHSRDVIVLPERVVGNWWRRDGHSLVIEDLDEVLNELPEHLVVGCGHDGRLRPSPSVADALAERGIEMEALPTDQAVRRYEELRASNPAATAAALHLTC